jgi:hypothetical protein
MFWRTTLHDDPDFLTNFSSAVTLDLGDSHTVREMLTLPQLVKSTVAPRVQPDPAPGDWDVQAYM